MNIKKKKEIKIIRVREIESPEFKMTASLNE